MSKSHEGFSVKVVCDDCGQVFWEADLLAWGNELLKHYVPAWFSLARLHEKDMGHQVMVKYPNQTVSLKLREIYGVYY